MAELQQKIQERAYFYFLERGGDSGREIDDWLRAEREIVSVETAAKTPVLMETASVAEKRNAGPRRPVAKGRR
ncbi:MAG TPA: DUF2934 domain-containing protein [Chitinivibrionales bacterium]|nr:DUF2934 domain-containing protein [Chitinivibrionales bacterium]